MTAAIVLGQLPNSDHPTVPISHRGLLEMIKLCFRFTPAADSFPSQPNSSLWNVLAFRVIKQAVAIYYSLQSYVAAAVVRWQHCYGWYYNFYSPWSHRGCYAHQPSSPRTVHHSGLPVRWTFSRYLRQHWTRSGIGLHWPEPAGPVYSNSRTLSSWCAYPAPESFYTHIHMDSHTHGFGFPPHFILDFSFERYSKKLRKSWEEKE